MTKQDRIEASTEELEAFCQRMRERVLKDDDYELAAVLAETLIFMKGALEEKRISINRLLDMIFGSSGTEKSRKIMERIKGMAAAERKKGKKKAKGHGRNGHEEYTGAARTRVPLDGFSPGMACPDCHKGKVYTFSEYSPVLRITGQAPIQAKVWELERYRCNLCSKVFTAKLPPEAGDKKYDEAAGAMVANLKYGYGVPFNRLEQIQEAQGVPLPASTQWEIAAEVAESALPAFQELRREAAQSEVVHNDDTTMKVLDLMPQAPATEPEAEEETTAPAEPEGEKKKGKKERTGVFTSAVVAVSGERKIAIFHTGREHAGESLAGVLKERTVSANPIQMCDGLSRNLPPEFKTILANCLTHGRRKFVEVAEAFPEQCLYVIGILKDVYHHDAIAREKKLSPEERLAFHQKKSKPLMDTLHEWLTAQFAEKKAEPNSSLGKAIFYMLKHWTALTLFLKVPGAPLDNNLAERVLKRAILHRKNSYYYKTKTGAAVGDLFMSLIQTCRLCGANSIEYLTELQRHAAEVAADPKKWMPWNYREALAAKARDGPKG